MALPRAYWLLWCGQTFSRIGILAPAFLVLYLQDGGLTDDRTTALVVGLFGAGVVSAGLIGGVVADTFGARRTIILAQPVAVLTALAFVVATDIVLISVLALLAGFLSAVDRPAGAGLIAKLVPQELFSRAYSLFLVGFNIGMSLSPVLAGFMLALYPPGLFLLWAVCAVLFAAMVWTLPAEEPSADGAQPEGSVLRRATRGILEPFRSRVMLVFLGLTFLLAVIYLQVNSTLPLDMSNEGLKPEQIGIVLAVNAVLSVALLPLVPRVVRSMRDEVPLVLASVLIAIGFGFNALAHDLPMFVVALIVWTTGEILWAPMSATFLAKRAPAGRTSTYQGSFFFAWNAAFVVGGPIGITVANVHGYGVVWIATLILGMLAALGFVLMTKIPGYNADSSKSTVSP